MKEVGWKYQITSLPTIKFFFIGKKETPTNYSGTKDEPSLKQFYIQNANQAQNSQVAAQNQAQIPGKGQGQATAANQQTQPSGKAQMNVIELTSATFFKKTHTLNPQTKRNEPNGYWLIEFYSGNNCTPCLQLDPQYQAASQKMNGKVRFGKINAYANVDLVKQYAVTAVPTILLFKPRSIRPSLYSVII